MNNTNTTPTHSRGQATRTDILQVARQLFSKHGYHRTGIADIQEATGLTKGAFYHHFHSKEDLALAVLERTRQEYAEQLFGPAMKQHTAADRLEALLDRAAALNNRPEWCNCQMLATLTAELTPADGRLREAVQDIYDDLQDRCRKLLSEARDAGHTSEQVDPDTGAQWIANTLTGLSLAKKLGIARVPASNLLDAMKRTLIKRSGKVKVQASGNGETSRSQPRTIPGGRSDA